MASRCSSDCRYDLSVCYYRYYKAKGQTVRDGYLESSVVQRQLNEGNTIMHQEHHKYNLFSYFNKKYFIIQSYFEKNYNFRRR